MMAYLHGSIRDNEDNYGDGKNFFVSCMQLRPFLSVFVKRQGIQTCCWFIETHFCMFVFWRQVDLDCSFAPRHSTATVWLRKIGVMRTILAQGQSGKVLCMEQRG
jgi:hypothetical protein